jgi:hypothetical protein
MLPTNLRTSVWLLYCTVTGFTRYCRSDIHLAQWSPRLFTQLPRFDIRVTATPLHSYRYSEFDVHFVSALLFFTATNLTCILCLCTSVSWIHAACNLHMTPWSKFSAQSQAENEVHVHIEQLMEIDSRWVAQEELMEIWKPLIWPG